MLAIGLKHRQSLVVEAGRTVPGLSPTLPGFREMPPVFASAMMIAFIESTCLGVIAPHLAAGEGSVGVHFDVSHSAATPIGMTVTAEAELVAIEGRRLRFAVVCRDDADIIGEGHHERMIIDESKFRARVDAKAAGVST
jgi:fluoroacetyl-CoA thioesterase